LTAEIHVRFSIKRLYC